MRPSKVTGFLAAAALGMGLCFVVQHTLSTPAQARIEWNQPAAGAKSATIDAIGVVEKLFQSDRYKPARDAKEKELADKLKPLGDELEGIRTKLSAMGQNTPEFQTLFGDYQQKGQTFQQASQAANGQLDQLSAAQVSEAFKLVVTTVEAIATARGYTHVNSAKAPGSPIRSGNVQGVLQEILARPILKSPAADDITADVEKELKVDTVQLTPPPGPGPGPAPELPAPAPVTK
jgi:hypothetical protein